MVASGNKLAIRSRFSGTATDPGEALRWGARDGRVVLGRSDRPVVTVNDEGLYAEHYGLFDVPGMLMQVGLMPSPSPEG